jgi:tetratricopeptide (TPR) repeat protein
MGNKHSTTLKECLDLTRRAEDYYAICSYEKARELFDDAKTGYLSLGRKYDAVVCYESMAQSTTALKEYDQASKMWIEIGDFWVTQVHNKYDALNSYIYVSYFNSLLCSLASGNIDATENLLTQCEEKCKWFSDQMQRDVIKKLIFHKRAGDRGDRDNVNLTISAYQKFKPFQKWQLKCVEQIQKCGLIY